MGIAGGLVLSGQQGVASETSATTLNAPDTAASQKPSKMTEKELIGHLNSEGKSVYQRLSPEDKELALKLASQSCKGQNDCKGQNSCKTAENSCSGQGGCKGKSRGPFMDKNNAVKIASKLMADKRATLSSSK